MPESRSRKKATYTPPPSSHEPPSSPSWWVPTMLTLMIAGLVWVVTTYIMRGDYPVPGIGNWNLAIGFVLMISGFSMTMRWR